MTPELLLELELVEEGIVVDPTHRHHRKDRSDGSIVDLSAVRAGLLVAYEMGDDNAPTLLDLRDLTRF